MVLSEMKRRPFDADEKRAIADAYIAAANWAVTRQLLLIEALSAKGKPTEAARAHLELLERNATALTASRNRTLALELSLGKRGG